MVHNYSQLLKHLQIFLPNRTEFIVFFLQNKLLNTLRPRHNGRHFADYIFRSIFLNENVSIPIKFSLKFVPKGPINYIPALVQIMAWRWPGDKPLSEPMIVRLPTHICVAWPQWVRPYAKLKVISTDIRKFSNLKVALWRPWKLNSCWCHAIFYCSSQSGLYDC